MSENGNMTFRQRVILWSNRILFDFKFKRDGRLFKLVMPEKYKPVVKTLKILFTLISLFSALFVFRSVFAAFGFGLVVYLLISVIERIVFTYSSLYVHPFPDFEIESEKWAGVYWGFAKDPKGEIEIPLLGMQFTDDDYARKIYTLLLKWVLGNHKDEKNNIKMSAIVTDNNSYVFFCYPSIDREAALYFYKKAEKDRGKESIGDLHNRMAMMLVLAKDFDILERSYFPTFRHRYKDGIPYLFQLGVAGEDGTIRRADGTDDLVLYNLKIMDKEDLTRKDIEYDLLRLFK